MKELFQDILLLLLVVIIMVVGALILGTLMGWF